MHKRIHRNELGQETEVELIQENIVLEKDENDDVTEEKPVEKEKKLPRLRATLTNTQHRTRGLADTSSDKRVSRDLGTQ
jgi:hypothetical protein